MLFLLLLPLSLQRHFDRKVAHGEAGAGMDISVQLILRAAPVSILGDEYIARQQPAPAPAAYAAAASVRTGDSGAFQGNEDILVCIARDIEYLVAHLYLQVEHLVLIRILTDHFSNRPQLKTFDDLLLS